MPGALGRITPPDDAHIRAYPLSALPVSQQPTQVPLWIGINWYVEFDSPKKNSQGHWWVASNGKLTTIRGGHSVCLEPTNKPLRDPTAWHPWFNQGHEGICVSEGGARTMGLLNRVRYQPRWLYDRCKERDGIPNEDGTYVSVGLDVIRTMGLVKSQGLEPQNLTPHALDGRTPDLSAGISANRWVENIDDAFRVLGHPDRSYAVILNSWGNNYPRRVRIPRNVLARLLNEGGEFAVVTDR